MLLQRKILQKMNLINFVKVKIIFLLYIIFFYENLKCYLKIIIHRNNSNILIPCFIIIYNLFNYEISININNINKFKNQFQFCHIFIISIFFKLKYNMYL